MNSLRALAPLRTDVPPESAQALIDSVYQIPIDDGLRDSRTELESLRFFISYAGSGPGQLDLEIDLSSWHVVPTSNKNVFAEDPRALKVNAKKPMLRD